MDNIVREHSHFKVLIDSSSNIIYSSYYIQGLYDVFGKKQVSFSTEPFVSLRKREDDYSYDAYMALVVYERGFERKIIIDFGDDSPIRENAYQWCDIYAKINIDKAKVSDQFAGKLFSIPPGFGIKIWTLPQTLYYAFSNLFKLRFSPQISPFNHLRAYLSQHYKQLPLRDFTKRTDFVKTKYIFFVASLWPHPNCLTGTNWYRKLFIEACKNSRISFEGGFWVSDPQHPQFEEVKNLTITTRYPLNLYVQKTEQSLVVFNTPAVHNCHGWKLGQFLAMGKAIISTPMRNSLPEDLVHGKNIYIVNNESKFGNAIDKICSNDAYRENLESEARRYFERQASPEAVIKNIVNRIQNTITV